MKVGTLLQARVHTFLTHSETPDSIQSVFLSKGALLLYLGTGDNLHGDCYHVMTRGGVIGYLSSTTVKEVG